MKKILFLGLVAFFSLTGCSKKVYDSGTKEANANKTEVATTPPVIVVDAPFAGQRFTLREINGNPILQGERNCMMQFEKSGKFSAYAGCNNMSGKYSAMSNDKAVKFSQVAATRMACPDMTNEQQFMKALDVAVLYSFDGAELIFTKADGTVLLRLEKM